jgi:hypothetical protein
MEFLQGATSHDMVQGLRARGGGREGAMHWAMLHGQPTATRRPPGIGSYNVLGTRRVC